MKASFYDIRNAKDLNINQWLKTIKRIYKSARKSNDATCYQ